MAEIFDLPVPEYRADFGTQEVGELSGDAD